MRKSLVLALVAASMLLGCGYDNGKDEEGVNYKSKVETLEGQVGDLNDKLTSAETAKNKAEEDKLAAEQAKTNAETEKNNAVNDINKQHAEEIDDINKQHDEEIEDINKKHEEEINDINKKHDEEIEELNNRLLPMPGSCTSTTDCKGSNGKILGLCEEKICKRTCTTIKDCEDQSICDAGVCRPVVKCPTMSFSHLDSDLQKKADKKYKNAKCMKVFSHTPSVGFADALNRDAEIKDSYLNDPLLTGDFTSDNYTFVIPNRALEQGLSFGMITYATIRFINLLDDASDGLAECLRPEVLDDENYSYNGIGGSVKGYKYLSQYSYSFTNDSLDSSAVASLCDNGTNYMQYDMMAYTVYLYYVDYMYDDKPDEDEWSAEKAVSVLNGTSTDLDKRIENIISNYKEVIAKVSDKGVKEDFFRYVFTEYMKMVKMKQSCLVENTNIDNLMVMAGLTAQVTNDKESQLATMAKVVDTYVSDPENLSLSDENNVDDVKKILAYLQGESSIWSATLAGVLLQYKFIDESEYVQLASSSVREIVDKLLDKLQAMEMITAEQNAFLSSLSTLDLAAALASQEVFKASPYNMLPVIIQYSELWRLRKLSRDYSEDNFMQTVGENIMNSQKRLCIETLFGVSKTTSFSRFIASPDMQLDACIMAPNVISGLINMTKLVTADKADNILYSGDYDAIHASLLDPTYLWFSNATLQSIDVKIGDKAVVEPQGFILDTTYNVPKALFTDQLVGDTYIQAIPTELTNYIISNNLDASGKLDLVAQIKKMINFKNAVISTRGNYFKTSTDGSHHAFLYDIPGEKDCDKSKLPEGVECPSCKNGTLCTFDFSIVSKKLEDSIMNNASKVNTDDPYKCGGMVYNVTKIDGYVVIPDDFEFSGKTVAAADNPGSSESGSDSSSGNGEESGNENP